MVPTTAHRHERAGRECLGAAASRFIAGLRCSWTTVAVPVGAGSTSYGWCTPGVHGPEVTGGNRRQRDAGFTLRTAVRAWSSAMFVRFNSPLAHSRRMASDLALWVSGWGPSSVEVLGKVLRAPEGPRSSPRLASEWGSVVGQAVRSRNARTGGSAGGPQRVARAAPEHSGQATSSPVRASEMNAATASTNSASSGTPGLSAATYLRAVPALPNATSTRW